MSMGEVVELESAYLARCPDCRESEWEIIVDKPGDFNVIKGIECTNCGMFVEFEMQVLGRKIVIEEGT